MIDFLNHVTTLNAGGFCGPARFNEPTRRRRRSSTGMFNWLIVALSNDCTLSDASTLSGGLIVSPCSFGGAGSFFAEHFVRGSFGHPHRERLLLAFA